MQRVLRWLRRLFRLAAVLSGKLVCRTQTRPLIWEQAAACTTLRKDRPESEILELAAERRVASYDCVLVPAGAETA